MALEREIKLQFATAAEARAAVLKSGARPLAPRRLQHDQLLDTDDGLLVGSGCALRVRTESGGARVTFKGPVEPSTHKLRDELETRVGDAEVLLQILAALGFSVRFRYEKYREEFAGQDVVIAVDETPVGTFVEIEGSEDGIRSAAAPSLWLMIPITTLLGITFMRTTHGMHVSVSYTHLTLPTN